LEKSGAIFDQIRPMISGSDDTYSGMSQAFFIFQTEIM